VADILIGKGVIQSESKQFLICMAISKSGLSVMLQPT
jgi:hypothetical protein